MYVVVGSFQSLKYQQVSVTSATIIPPPAGTTMMLISVETNGVRFRDDGTNPTTAIGMPLSVGTQNFIYTGYPGGVAFIAQAGTATLDVTFYQGQH